MWPKSFCDGLLSTVKMVDIHVTKSHNEKLKLAENAGKV